MKKIIKLGLGFATGRKSFRKVLNAYISNWSEARKNLPEDLDVHLNLFVAYDLDYLNTKSTDYTNLSQEMVDAFEDIVFLGAKNALKSIDKLTKSERLSATELRSVFGAGYAGKRNAILFAALENHVDYLLFLDDDEYPVAVTNNHNICLWSGQHVLRMHLNEIQHADYTNGYHCGYISPIPYMEFNEKLAESDFRAFIEAISNDIINWDNIRRLMQSGGVTYADTSVLTAKPVRDVQKINGCKFISGANLCLNLQNPARTFPFYNPPGARGEDTFLSTLLSERVVRQIPCYAFHDGFSIYKHLLDGVLPTKLSPITSASAGIITRFLAACTGWVRYKPLLVYLTRPEDYEREMQFMRQTLCETLPKIADYFHTDRFMAILDEFEKYQKNTKKHYEQFQLTQRTWKKLLQVLEQSRESMQKSYPV
ncbi:MAG: hypothetical protein VB049_10370 [Candidatus Pelethousia sp.]|nr:hypothetical protein [Candidatus Pelethousia sp.]